MHQKIYKTLSDCFRYTLHQHGIYGDQKNTSLVDLSNQSVGLHGSRIQGLIPLSVSRNFHKSGLCILEQINKWNHLLRIRCVRKTLYYVSPKLAPILHSATRGYRKQFQERYARKYKLPLKERQRAQRIIENALIDRGRTYNDLVMEVEQRIGAQLSCTIDVQKLVYSAFRALWGNGKLVVRNTDLRFGKEKRIFDLLENVFPGLNLNIDETDAIKKLLFLYIKCYGPVTFQDICWWTGLPSTKVKLHLESINDIRIIRLKNSSKHFYVTEKELEKLQIFTEENDVTPIFLGFEDTLLKGYFDTRNRYRIPRALEHVVTNGGEIRPCILSSNKIIGLWSWDKKNHHIEWLLYNRTPKIMQKSLSLARDELVSEIKKSFDRGECKHPLKN